MLIYKNLKAAEDFGLDRAYVVNSRRRFLTSRLDTLDEQVKTFNPDNWPTRSFYYAYYALEATINAKEKVMRELDAMKRINTEAGLQDAQIQAAREYDVSKLVEWQHRKSTAWCHEDRRPSLTLLTRINQLWCPVCDKKFDAIGVLMDRDGMRFVDAVKALS
jgi:hypothetical protein